MYLSIKDEELFFVNNCKNSYLETFVLHLHAGQEKILPTTHVHAGTAVVFIYESCFLHKLARTSLASKCKSKISHILTRFIKNCQNLYWHACNFDTHVYVCAIFSRLHTRFEHIHRKLHVLARNRKN